MNDDTRAASDIYTPDQRLRVFVSSTLGELAPEREAAQTAVTTLRLTPVMFELGARPHPPQHLYRAYLKQSQIFVGIYWESYGWVAPGTSISGIEDEWLLATDLPRLVYVKEPAPDRQPELAALLERIAQSGISYKTFGSPGQLAEQLLDDLAVLISERFEAEHEAAQRLPSGTVTFLIADLEDSTGMLERLEGTYVEILQTYRGLIDRALAASGGFVVGSEGDGFLCAFGDAGSAAMAAVETQRSMASQSWPAKETVKARIGLHTGTVKPLDGSYVGLELHRAFRIAAASNGGQILISSTTRRLLERTIAKEGWRAGDLGYFALKGLSHTEHIYQLEAPGLANQFPPVRAKAAATVRLPAQLTTLVGRDQEVQEVAELVSRPDVRLVSLSGPGGIGKTRLAVAVAGLIAHGYPDGVYFVGLDRVGDAGALSREMAAALGLPVEGRGAASSVVTDYLATKRILLLLDNFEQLVAAAASQVSELLAQCPGLELLVTSRIALRVSGEHEYQVPPLQLPSNDRLEQVEAAESVRLFVERATASRPQFALNPANAPIVAAICRTLDGHPLAIELAAARVRLLAPQALLERLNRSLDFLTGGPVDAPDRHRTLRAAIQWSFEMLTPEEQKLFARLGVFAGGCSFEAVQSVCTADLGDPLPLIESLVDKSLIRVEEGPDQTPRINMLTTLVEFARSELDRMGETDDMRRRQAEYFCEFAQELAPELRGPEQRRALERCDVEYHNLQAAGSWLFDHGQAGRLARILAQTWPFYWLRGHMVEGRAWSNRLADPAVPMPPAEKGWALFLAAGSALEMGDYEPALKFATAALVEFDQTDEVSGSAWAHLMRAAALPSFAFAGEAATSIRHIEDAVSLFHAAGDSWGEAYAHNYVGTFAAIHGRFDEAFEALRKCLDLATTLKCDSLIGQANNLLGMAHLLAGDNHSARVKLAAAAQVYGSGYLLEGLAYCLETISGFLVADGNPIQGMTALGAAEAIRDVLQLRPWPITQPFVDGLIASAEQDPDYQAARAAGRQLSPQAAAELAVNLTSAVPVNPG